MRYHIFEASVALQSGEPLCLPMTLNQHATQLKIAEVFAGFIILCDEIATEERMVSDVEDAYSPQETADEIRRK